MADMIYGNGKNTPYGEQNQTFYYERKALQRLKFDVVYQQWCDLRHQPQNNGKEFRISVWHNTYGRLPFDTATWNTLGPKVLHPDFMKHGYLADRDVADVSTSILGDGILSKGFEIEEGQNSGFKQIEVRKSTFSTKLIKLAGILNYTGDSLLFSEDQMAVQYREQIVEFAKDLYEDLVQLDMLATTNVVYAGGAISMETLGAGIGKGEKDPVSKTNALEDAYKVNYELLQTSAKKLYNYKAPKHQSLVGGSTQINTTRIPECWVAITDSNVIKDLQNTVRGATYERRFEFIDKYKYGSLEALPNEVGSCGEFRFLRSDRALRYAGRGAVVDDNYVGDLSFTEVPKTNGGGTERRFDVYQILVPCKEAISTVSLMGRGKIEFKHKDPNKIELTDPVGEKGFHAFKFWYATVIVRPERLMKILCLATR